jgi:hypothetical protein
VPLTPYLGGNTFDPDAIKAMTTAFKEACEALRLADRDDPLVAIVATKIIEVAKGGERDPVRLRDKALTSLDGRTPFEPRPPR